MAAFFAAYVVSGMHAHARTTGTISGLGLRAPVQILRDDRGVPHIIASNEHDLFFAQGYVEGSDRLFQMDLLRRFVLGHLAEVFGAPALSSDETQRAVPVRRIVDAQWARLDPDSRAILGAFSDGVNAAIQNEPLPVEFRVLAYRPAAWTPRDSLAVAMATVLDLIDDWNSVASRDAAYRHGGRRALERRFPFTDACYDAPVTAGLAGMGPGDACKPSLQRLLGELGDARPPIGSNEWAVGANRSQTHRALLANDPHLALNIPGVWYLVDLHAPSFHAAGATFPGDPGVVLGHNAHLAWAATDGTVTSLSVFSPPAHLRAGGWQTERFAVRFRRGEVTKRYYRGRTAFGVTTHGRLVLVRWNFYTNPVSPAPTFVALDRAATMRQAIAALAAFPGPTQNFALADTRGRAAYVLAGSIPADPLCGRRIHSAADLSRRYAPVPFAALPKVAPSRNAIVWTANNKMYPGRFPVCISPQFAPPYRAYRIAQLLRARATYDTAYFTRMQMDVLSLPERELARDLAPSIRPRNASLAAALTAWNGEMRGDSTTATVVERLRVALTGGTNGRMPAVLASHVRLRRSMALPAPQRWSVAGATRVEHPLSSLGIDFLNGTTLPGMGDAYTLHVLDGHYSQSFRAVWDVGNWDAGGIVLPQGESGEPGSGHYTDQAAAWISGRLWPLPFSDAAVARTAVTRETLAP